MAWPTLTDTLITTEVRALLGEPTARRVSDAEIVRWINKAVSLIMRRNLACGEVYSVLLAANDFTPTPPADVISIRSVVYTQSVTAYQPGSTGKALLKMHPRHFSNIQAYTAGAPQEWAWFDDILYIWPLPDSDAHAKYLTVFYYASHGAVAIASGDFYKFIPFHYQPYIIWYAYAQALMKIGKAEQALQYMSYFDNFIAFHRQNDHLYTGVDSADMMNLPDRVEFVG